MMCAMSQRTDSEVLETPPGHDLRQRVEALGTRLAEDLNLVIAGLPDRPTGPRALGRALDLTTVTASRLLKAIAQHDPIAVLQLVPGPNPLGKMIDSIEAITGATEASAAARRAVGDFDALIRDEAGDRGSLKAMLSAWLPEERREFEAQRRQAVFKALAEMEGVSCDLELSSLFLSPSEADGEIDIVNVKALLGIDRIRPDAVVKLGTRRLESGDEAAPRMPLTLGGEPAVDGLHTVRLDEFCSARPAPLLVRQIDAAVQYQLGPTGFGRESKRDLVIAELNRGELPHREPSAERPPHFFMVPEMPTRKAILDLFVHRDIYPGEGPELLCYDTTGSGPARAGDESRALDRRPIFEPVQRFESGPRGARLVEFPQYTALIERVADTTGWVLADFRLYRVAVSYALLGRQLTLAFTGASAGTLR